MGHLVTLFQKSKIILKDGYNRLDNAVTMGSANTGQVYVPSSGTWGISGNRAYCVSDITGEITIVETGKNDFTLFSLTNGQTTVAGTQRLLNTVFRALDSSNFLMTRITAGAVNLFKNVAGTLTMISSIAFTDVDNTDYRFRVFCQGNTIMIYVDGVLKINYALTGGETVFAGPTYTKAGYRLTKSGAPTGSARADNLMVEAL